MIARHRLTDVNSPHDLPSFDRRARSAFAKHHHDVTQYCPPWMIPQRDRLSALLRIVIFQFRNQRRQLIDVIAAYATQLSRQRSIVIAVFSPKKPIKEHQRQSVSTESTSVAAPCGASY